jgi:hypothetical protein
VIAIPPSALRFLTGLGPYPSLLILVVPLAIVEPLKLVSVFIFGESHFIAAVLIMTCAYAASLFVTGRLFKIVKPKLLTLQWFTTIWSWFVAVRDRTLRWLSRSVRD